MNEQEKLIRKKKKTGYRIYGENSQWIHFLLSLLCALLIDSALEILLADAVPFIARLVLYVAVVILMLLVFYLRGRRGQKVEAYCRQNGFEFVGLCDLSNESSLGSRDVLPRDAEIEMIHRTLETVILPQKQVKQALCLTGKSGCGKSTILAFFKIRYGSDYIIIDLTGDYTNFPVIFSERMGIDCSDVQALGERVATMSRERKVVFLFDQFERFFFLPEEKKQELRMLLVRLSMENTALIISLREEYLADFMKEFDVNNLKKDYRSVNGEGTMGILNHLTSVIRDNTKNYYIAPTYTDEIRTMTWNHARVKANFSLHLENPRGRAEEIILEPVSNTIFYCENQNDIRVRGGGVLKTASVLQLKCEMAFGDAGKRFFERHQDEPLLKQQIFYHLAEYEKKVRKASDEEMEALFSMESDALMNHYFDVQLTSTDDYFLASRIVYLLSEARMNHVVMRMEDIRVGLLENIFSTKGFQKVPLVMAQLEQLQLVRRNIERSEQEYEIAHDLIAQAYLNYAHSNMNRNVKNALDICMAEYLDAEKEETRKEKKAFLQGVQKNHFYKIVIFIAVVAAAAVQAWILLGYNPWMKQWSQYNAFGSIQTVYPFLMTVFSLVYIYNIFQKALLYYRGRKEKGNRILFLVVNLCCIGGIACYPHGLAFYGVLLAIVGFRCAFLLDRSGQKSSSRELRNYGLRCALIGIVFTVMHFFLYGFAGQLPSYLIFMEIVAMGILVAYSYVSHMTEEFLYARAVDAGSESGL